MMGVLLEEISEDGDLKRYTPPAQDSKFAAPIGYEPRRFEIPPTQDSGVAWLEYAMNHAPTDSKQSFSLSRHSPYKKGYKRNS